MNIAGVKKFGHLAARPFCGLRHGLA